MEGLPGVADRSWPCPPLDLLRSPAERLESTRFAILPVVCVLPPVPAILQRLARLTSDLKGVLETAREQDPL